MKEQSQKVNFKELLGTALTNTGKLLEAYKAFNTYSFGNQMLLLGQFAGRQVDPAPVATFKQWQDKGYKVKKGEKALKMYIPCPIKTEEERGGEIVQKSFTFFKVVPRWFSLDQVEPMEGAKVKAIKESILPNFDFKLALETLGISEVKFSHHNGNCQGYAKEKTIAVNPLAQLPNKTRFHEMAHVLLGHTDMIAHDFKDMPRDLKEVEAESVAMLCLGALGLEGVEYCRGYIQNWYDGEEIPEANCRRIMQTADKILKAGNPELKKDSEGQE
jgi:antirestriction protein ArdC